jgi:hypothetical protein
LPGFAGAAHHYQVFLGRVKKIGMHVVIIKCCLELLHHFFYEQFLVKDG